MKNLRPLRQLLASAGVMLAATAPLAITPVSALAQQAAATGHFDPKGKAPSKFTLEVLERSRATLPFADTRDFDEQKKGFIAPMKDLKIMADAGHVAWDMERFQFLTAGPDFDSIHPSLHARSRRLNNNYGLYEVIPGIYQVRGFDLSDITFVRGKTGWIVFDPLVTAETGARRPGSCSSEHVGEGLPVIGRDLLALPRRPLGRRARPRRRGRRARREGADHRAGATSWSTRSRRTSTPATR